MKFEVPERSTNSKIRPFQNCEILFFKIRSISGMGVLSFVKRKRNKIDFAQSKFTESRFCDEILFSNLTKSLKNNPFPNMAKWECFLKLQFSTDFL